MEALKRVCLLSGASGLLGTAFIEAWSETYEIAALHRQRPIYSATKTQSFVDPLEPTRNCPVNKRRVWARRVDLTDSAAIDQLAQEVLEEVGVVDVLINAATVREFAPLLSPKTGETAESVFRLNVLAPLSLTLALARLHWKDAEENAERNRNVVNISSTAGQYVYPDLGQALYGTSKAALNHLTYHLASELWDLGIRVNAVAPDSFPGRAETTDVVEAIGALDQSSETGRIVELPSAV